jgi:hypothetical protein
MTNAAEEFTELVDGSFPRVDLVGKSANGIHRFLIAKSEPTDTAQGIVEASAIRDLVSKSSPKEPEVTTDSIVKADDLDAGETFVGDPNAVVQPGSPEWETVDADTADKWVGILARAMNAVNALATREQAEVFAENGDGSDVWSLEDAACAIQCAIDSLAPFAVSERVEADMELPEGVFKAASALAEDPEALQSVERFNAIYGAGRGLSSEVAKSFHRVVAEFGATLAQLPAPEGTVMKNENDAVIKDGTMGDATSPVPGTTQAGIYAGETGQSSPNGNAEQNPANEGNPVVADDSSLAIPTDVKTLDGLAGSQDDTTGTDAMVGQAVVDTGVVTKAADQQAVYDSQGNLIGVVDPSKITKLIGEGAADAATTVEAPEAEGGDTSAAAETAADSGTDGGDTGTDTSGAAPAAPVAAPAVAATDDDTVMKSAIDEGVKAALAEMDVVPTSVVKALEDRFNEFMEAPAKSRVLSHGAKPTPEMLRGLDKEAAPANVAKAAELRESLDSELDVEKRAAIEKEMHVSAIDAYNELRRAQPGGLNSLVQ